MAVDEAHVVFPTPPLPQNIKITGCASRLSREPYFMTKVYRDIVDKKSS